MSSENGTAIEVRATANRPALVPANVSEALKLAQLMAESKLLPVHLQGKPADAFLVVEQSMRWGLSPFAVAQCTSVIQGKLMFEGKLVAAVVNARGGLSEKLSFAFDGAGNTRAIKVSGKIRGEKEARTVDVKFMDAKTANPLWTKQPDQQLVYHGSRVWARRHTPELMLGITCPEEFDPEPTDVTPHAEPEPQPVIEELTGMVDSAAAAKDAEGRPIYVVTIAGTRTMTRDLTLATEAKRLGKEKAQVAATVSRTGKVLQLVAIAAAKTPPADGRDVATDDDPDAAPLPLEEQPAA